MNYLVVTNTGKRVQNGLDLLIDVVVSVVGAGVWHGITVESVGVFHYAEITTLKQRKTTCTLSKSSTIGYTIIGETTSEVQRLKFVWVVELKYQF